MLNKCIMIGRLTEKPELRHTHTDGTPVCNFTLAINRPFKNKDGEEKADFIRVTVWKSLAENVAKYLGKGDMCCVVGRLSISLYDDKEGVRRLNPEIVAEDIRFLSTKRASDTAEQHDGGPYDEGQYDEDPVDVDGNMRQPDEDPVDVDGNKNDDDQYDF